MGAGGIAAQGSQYAGETAQRSFDVLVKRIAGANSSLVEARMRLGGFSDRLSGPVPQAIGQGSDKNQIVSEPQSMEARLMAQITTYENQVGELHELIGRLERSL